MIGTLLFVYGVYFVVAAVSVALVVFILKRLRGLS